MSEGCTLPKMLILAGYANLQLGIGCGMREPHGRKNSMRQVWAFLAAGRVDVSHANTVAVTRLHSWLPDYT